MDQGSQNISKSSVSTTYPPATAGGTDPIHARRLTFEALPRAERVQIPRASHIVHEDNPAAFNEALIAFLAKQRIE